MSGMIVNPYVLGAAGGGGFSPTSLPSLERWFDPSDNTTVTEVSGKVSALADKSGNGYDLSQGTSGRRPVLSAAAINGLDAIDYDGSLTSLTETSAIGLPSGSDQPFSVFAVVHSDATGDAFWSFGRASSGSPWIYAYISSNWGVSKRDDTTTSKSVSGATSSDTTSPHLISVICNGTSVDIRLDGVADATAGDLDVGTTTLDQFALGSRYIQGSYQIPFNGLIAEVIHCSTDITGSDLTDCETYLISKWGI